MKAASPPPTTMNEIANRVGVSRSTVSIVLNGRHYAGVTIGTDTRDRVLEAARDLGYRRNALARAIVSGHSRSIGFLVENPAYEPVAQMLAGALDEAEDNDYFVKVLRVRDTKLDQKTIDRCIELRLEGVITLYLAGQADLLHAELDRYGTPIVLLESAVKRSWGTRVVTEDRAGCAQMMDHLYSLGHRRIAFVAGRLGSEGGAPREVGFRESVDRLGLSVPQSYYERGNWRIEDTEAAVARLLHEVSPRPSAIFCANDIMAMGAIRQAHRAGLRVPEDLSVAGFTNLSIADYSDPPLTSVAQPFLDMGRSAVRHLVARSENPESAVDCEIVLPSTLVVRSSTAPAPE